MSSIKYTVPTLTERKEYIQLALDNKLYVKGFCLEGWYMDALTIRSDRKEQGRPHSLICLAYDNDTPIGICFVYGSVLSVYVKPHYRRNGIGRQLTRELLKQHPIQGTYTVSPGIKGSIEFYERIGAIDYC